MGELGPHEALAALLRQAGFTTVDMLPLTLGIATLTIATRGSTLSGTPSGTPQE